MLSGRGYCDGPITRPEESVSLVCLSVIVKASIMRRLWPSGVHRNSVRGVQRIQLKKEDRENGDLGAVAP